MSNKFEGYRIFFPQSKRAKEGLPIFPGTILEHARKLGVEIASECGGQGICGRCVVRIDRGTEALNPLTPAEKRLQLGRSERLACQATIEKPANIHVFVKNAGQYSILSETIHRQVEIAPPVYVGDGQVWRRGPQGERSLGAYRGHLYGLAIDVGTTTIVFQVVDLATGQPLATVARSNPQKTYGDDVISRIGYTMQNRGGLAELQTTVIEAINESLEPVLSEQGIDRDEFYDVVVVGNCTMRDIFFGIEVSSLGVIPFEPLSTDPVNVKAGELGLAINSEANVYGAPLIGGHAGADCVADILASGLYEAETPSMLVDIGTNGEVAIGDKHGLMTCSCAAGAAYEGAAVQSGVGAIEGAITNISLRNGQVDYKTIGDKPPVGICGSGLIDLLAQLLEAGIMTRKAKLPQAFAVTDGIVFTQQDVYQLITAKAGLRLDQDLLMKYYGVTADGIDKLYLAGAFGNYIDAANAVAIGLLPDARDKVVKLGNAALGGAWEMLVSSRSREQAETFAGKIEHIKPNELEDDFLYLVAEKMYF